MITNHDCAPLSERDATSQPFAARWNDVIRRVLAAVSSESAPIQRICRSLQDPLKFSQVFWPRIVPFFAYLLFHRVDVWAQQHEAELVHKQPILSCTGPQGVKVVSSSFFFVHASPVQAGIVGGKMVCANVKGRSIIR